MKKQTQKFKEGDIVVNARNGFRRIIRGVSYEEKDEMLQVRYFYSQEKLNSSQKPTGNFEENIDGNCTQLTMLYWQRG